MPKEKEEVVVGDCAKEGEVSEGNAEEATSEHEDLVKNVAIGIIKDLSKESSKPDTKLDKVFSLIMTKWGTEGFIVLLIILELIIIVTASTIISMVKG